MVRTVLAAMTCMLLGGCVIPLPHVKETCGPLCGYVVSESDRPVEAAQVEVSYPDGGVRRTETDECGHFEFGTKLRFHWGVMFGVALNYSLPYDMYPQTFSEVIVEAEGFERRVVRPIFYEEHFEDECAGTLYLNLEDDKCQFIELEKTHH